MSDQRDAERAGFERGIEVARAAIRAVPWSLRREAEGQGCPLNDERRRLVDTFADRFELAVALASLKARP